MIFIIKLRLKVPAVKGRFLMGTGCVSAFLKADTDRLPREKAFKNTAAVT